MYLQALRGPLSGKQKPSRPAASGAAHTLTLNLRRNRTDSPKNPTERHATYCSNLLPVEVDS